MIVTVVLEGKTPASPPKEDLDYLRKKLEETRKDCQWLMGLGAASVLGVVIKEDLGDSSPVLRSFVFAVIILQLSSSMLGAISKKNEVDSPQMMAALRTRLNRRLVIRNVAVILLGISFALVLLLAA